MTAKGRQAFGLPRDPKSVNYSKYVGVYKYQNSPGFAARIAEKHLGTFRTAERAAEAYDYEAKKIYGDEAMLNFPKKKKGAKNGRN